MKTRESCRHAHADVVCDVCTRGSPTRFLSFVIPTPSLLSIPLFAPSYLLLVFRLYPFHLTMADSIDDNDEEPALARMVSALAQRGVANCWSLPCRLVVGGGRQGIGAEVLPAQVFRSPRSAMLVQPQERLLSQHLQARLLVAILVAGGDSGLLVVVVVRWRSTTTMLIIGTDAVFPIGTDKSLEI